MTTMKRKRRRPAKRGRPAKRTMPDPIPDTLENIMRAIVNTPPKDEWRYLTEDGPDD